MAAKALLASLVLALAGAAAALGDAPTVKIAKADQARAEAALLRLGDFGAGWAGGPRPPTKLTAPRCPGFDPKESDLTVTGHAEASFRYLHGYVTFDQDTQVLEDARAVRTDFARTVRPGLAGCLAHELREAGKGQVVSVSVRKLALPRFGTTSAAYRATLVLRVGTRKLRLVDDFIFIGQGRLEYSLRIAAPAVEAPQLLPFEQAMAQLLVQRAGANVA